MVRQLRIYIDTNVVSGLLEEANHIHHIEGCAFFKRVKDSNFAIYISTLVEAELLNDIGRESEHTANLKKYKTKKIEINENDYELAQDLIKERIFSSKSFRDALHLACAINNQIDILCSWNFDDIVNIQTIKKLKIFTFKNNLKGIEIYSPMEIR